MVLRRNIILYLNAEWPLCSYAENTKHAAL